MNETLKQIALGQLRHLLTAGATALVAHGYANSNKVESIVSAGVVLVMMIWSALHKVTPKIPAPPEEDKNQSPLPGLGTLGVIAISCLLLFPIGCGKTTLQTGGAYAIVVGTTNMIATAAPDAAFYLVDSAFDFAYSSINAAFQFERDNRAYLWKLSPDIKHTLDKIRPGAVDAVKRYARARKAYMKNSTPPGLSVLQNILGEVQKVATATQAAIPSKP